ncbi:Transketolase domain-containing protein [Pseudopedobacter saltans DSM 12145]|uniref:3-methyl-2-oxobutanoate dehydrogenase (2-methylpropanoyl-transferring) n=1 Tax=Pseudopedobacter saltans (strain ATCC 51119 / DSM 12145 / JCM 21818 / CCUG 39354 / LMG 10337 / NBRC 100064 / NCIMB 13643) TaxID=762903 RepID=F0S9X1_PSESL|nr:alpha-ketoacid dehydrogenase subunit alpha/beta [Pseudopedobacter saltans]ADY52529.1 Transketolase domain-containing protein [Pseudopedobacter saltans DSM 12145]
MQHKVTNQFDTSELSFEDFKAIVIKDYKIAYESRQVSLQGRKEALTGKAKFGIFGDGKEIAQVAMSKAFKNGDWRSGYYRDQTVMFATGMATVKQFFAQLYAHPDLDHEPHSGGRQMNAHFASRSINPDGSWKDLTQMKNSASDVSSTATQMARLIGLAQASKLYRQNPELKEFSQFSINGNEVAFGTIGNASTSEGLFFEAINAAGVLQIPLAISIWDDGYGISVPNKYQTTKEDISEVLKGFQRTKDKPGIEIFKVKGWDYVALCETYETAIKMCREEHVPVLIHVTEMTQPQGHSTSGSHERYKSNERLEWEREYDCIAQMRKWMLESAIATEEEISELEDTIKNEVRTTIKQSWTKFLDSVKVEKAQTLNLLENLGNEVPQVKKIALIYRSEIDPLRKEMFGAIRKALRITRFHDSDAKSALKKWYEEQKEINKERYNSGLFSDTPNSPLRIETIDPVYSAGSRMVDGKDVLNACFEANFKKNPRLIAFGEDLGLIGDVNQGFAGLQAKFGEMRITDTGIREMTIIGQGIGLALRGFRPIAEIQYLDYIYFALNVLTDDLASLTYRTKVGQIAPMIVRTRGHRLEGIWHSGSPMSVILGSLKGVHLCVPRNMTQAAGMYNTLLRGDEPAVMIETLNGYRIKEKLPDNIGEFTVPLGKVEVLKEGKDITIVSYGAVIKQIMEAVTELGALGINVEVIDAQTLMPFDLDMDCAKSLQKTSKLLVVDEDVPGGASAYILHDILERQNGYYLLDAQPRTLSAKAHRPPYGSDGDYFSKPSTDDVIEAVYQMMSEFNPEKYPEL